MNQPEIEKKNRLIQSGLVVSIMTGLSRISGLIRDIVLAYTIGAQSGADAFFLAFKIPNFLRRLFAEGAFAQAFVPVLSEYRLKGSHEAVKGLIDRVCGCLAITLLGLTLLVIVFAPWITILFAPGFWSSPEKYQWAQDMLRITFPYLLLISLTGFSGAILNSYDRFAIPAFTPILLNVCLITAAIVLSPWFDPPAMALAWGVLAAGMVQLCFQIPFLHQLRLLPQPKIDFKDAGVRRILLLMAPAIFGVSVSQINLLLDTVLASFLPTGSISWLYYSDRLVELPLGIFAIALGTVILPLLSRQHAKNNSVLFSQTMDWALRCVFLIAIPASIALFMLSETILATLFHYGKTTEQDIVLSSLSLKAYALGLLGFMLIKVLAPGYFSRQDTKTPVKFGIIAMVSNMVFNVLLAIPLHVFFHIGHVGLALATSLSAFLNAGLLLRGLIVSRALHLEFKMWRAFGLQVITASCIMIAVLAAMLARTPDWFERALLWRVMDTCILCSLGLLVYLLSLLACGFRPRHLKNI